MAPQPFGSRTGGGGAGDSRAGSGAGLGASPPAPSCPPALLRLSSSDYTKILTRVLSIQVGK